MPPSSVPRGTGTPECLQILQSTHTHAHTRVNAKTSLTDVLEAIDCVSALHAAAAIESKIIFCKLKPIRPRRDLKDRSVGSEGRLIVKLCPRAESYAAAHGYKCLKPVFPTLKLRPATLPIEKHKQQR